ncbi:hypothetical protein BHM03_00046134 [Ensete ventricosum]|nr:hypothetical protein BHM03_00046134 [Ensete ventricosum]
MRLNHVELFCALIAAIGSESRHCLRGRGGHMHAVCMQRWLPTARPLAGAAGQGLATCKRRPPASTVGCDQPARASQQQPAYKGLPPAASPVASRGGDAGRRGGRPLAGRLSATKGNRRLRKGCNGNGAVRVES